MKIIVLFSALYLSAATAVCQTATYLDPSASIAARAPLQATSDRGLPVGFFVLAGPAQIVDNRLVFTAVPPRSAFPVAVTVAAWQWGRSSEPKIRQAETVKQTILIIR